MLTSDLGTEMLFQIQQHSSDVELLPDKPRLSNDQCVERLRESCFRSLMLQSAWSSSLSWEHSGICQAIRLYNDNDPQQPAPSVIMCACLDKQIDEPSKKYLGVETRFEVEKKNYCLHGNPNIDVGDYAVVNPIRLDVIRAYSTFEYDPTTTQTNNYFDFEAGVGRKRRTVLRLKPSSAQRLKGQLADNLVRLAELHPLQDDEDSADDWDCSEFVIGDDEARHVVWIEHDPM